MAVKFLCHGWLPTVTQIRSENTCLGTVPDLVDPVVPLPVPEPVFVPVPSEVTDRTMGIGQPVVLRVTFEMFSNSIEAFDPWHPPKSGVAGLSGGSGPGIGLAGLQHFLPCEGGLGGSYVLTLGSVPETGTWAVWRAHAHMSRRSLNLEIQ